MEVDASTKCAVTGRVIQMRIDSEMNHQVLTPDADPYVFEPHIDWQTFSAPNIIHDY